LHAVKWKDLVKVCESVGCRYDRQRGDHYIMVREGLSRPVVIPMKSNLKEDIVLGILRTIGLSKAEFLKRLHNKH